MAKFEVGATVHITGTEIVGTVMETRGTIASVVISTPSRMLHIKVDECHLCPGDPRDMNLTTDRFTDREITLLGRALEFQLEYDRGLNESDEISESDRQEITGLFEKIYR